jgi:DNA-binding MarR family transcriptional regulator
MPKEEEFYLMNKICLRINKALEQELEILHSIPLSNFEVLYMLGNSQDGFLSMNELAEQVDLTPSGLTRLIDRMVQLKLIERTSCPTDRRVVYVKLTEYGKNVFELAGKTYRQVLRENITNRLSDGELDQLRFLLQKLSN